MPNKPFILKPTSDTGFLSAEGKPWLGARVMRGCVVCAPDEAAARAIASRNAAQEGAKVWLDPNLTACTEITSETDGLVMANASVLLLDEWLEWNDRIDAT